MFLPSSEGILPPREPRGTKSRAQQSANRPPFIAGLLVLYFMACGQDEGENGATEEL